MDVFLVDAFSDGPFTGNPTMVCLVTQERALTLNDDLMQKIATEMNLPDTVFVTPLYSEGFEHFSLRWFSPTCEANLCGHGTLAVGAVLWTIYHNPVTDLYFHSLSGVLKTTHNATEDTVTINLPASYCETINEDAFTELIKLVTGDLVLSDCQYSKASLRLLLRLPDGTTRSQLESLTVDTNALLAVKQSQVKGVIVTVKSEDKEYDFYSRYFAPWWGNHEDPVTGAAHTTLAPYWSKVLCKSDMRARQCSARGGNLSVMMEEEDGRVLLTGRASIVMKGTLLV